MTTIKTRKMGVKGDVTPKHAPPFASKSESIWMNGILPWPERGHAFTQKNHLFCIKSNGHFEFEDHSDGASVSNWLLGSSDVSTVLTWSLLRWGHSPYEVGAFPLPDGDISLTRWVWGARASSGGRPLDRVVGQLGRVARMRKRKKRANYCIQYNLCCVHAYEIALAIEWLSESRPSGGCRPLTSD